MSRHVVRWPMKVINGKKKKKEIPGMGWGGGVILFAHWVQ